MDRVSHRYGLVNLGKGRQMDEVRIGCIGCGGNARGHMTRLTELEGARVAAVCDLIDDLAEQASELTGGQAYTDYRKMLERDDLDAVYLSIPVFAHGEPELAVIDRGLPFLVEKPVARDLETARKVEEAVAKSGLLTCVGYQLRYSGSAGIAKEVLSGETIGLASGKYWSGTGRGDSEGWLRQLDKSGGQVVEQATHTVDMMRYLVGEVAEVTARHASRQLHEIDCPDVHVVVFEFENGALGSLTTTWAYDPSDWSNANVLDILYGQSLLTWTSGRVAITQKGATSERTAEGRGIDEVFVQAVREGNASLIRSPYADGVKSLAVSLAALEAGEKRTSVRI